MMVKSDFFKSMKNTNFFKNYSKPLALLAILIILSIALFSSYNEYSLENLTPLGPTIDVMLWTDSYGSTSNSFVNTYWLGLINTYKGFPNINFGQRKISEMVKYFEPEKNPQFKGWDEAAMAKYVPCITILVDDKGVKSLLGAGAPGVTSLHTGPTLTLEHVMKSLGGVFSKNYDKLYSNKAPNVGMPAVPAVPAMPDMPAMPTGMPEVPTGMPDWMKMPGSS
jgi:hypothetical protein